MKGTVLVNVADLMERWTADKLKSTVGHLNCTSSSSFCLFFAYESETGQKSMKQLVNIKYVFFYPQNYEFLFVQKFMALETNCSY